MIPIHPRSLDFDWEAGVADHPPTFISSEQAAQFNERGFFVIDQVIDPETLAAVRAETDRFCQEADDFLDSLPDQRLFIAEKGAITFAPQIALRSDVLADFVGSAAIRGITTDLIGPDLRLYHDQAVYKASEKPRRFPWHQDNGYAFVTPEHYLTIWIALVDVPENAGCVWAAPGLHRRGTYVHNYVEPLGWQIFDEPPVTPVAAPISAGSAVVFSSLTPHLTAPNVSGNMRKAYILQFVGPNATRFEGPLDEVGTPLNDDRRYPWVVRGGAAVPTSH